MKSSFLFVLLLGLASTTVALESYLQGSKVYNVYSKSTEQARSVNGLEQVLEGLDFWQYGFGGEREATVLVPEHLDSLFHILVKELDATAEVFVYDVEGFLERERRENAIARENRRRESGKLKVDFTAYYHHDEINAHLDELQQKYPELVTVKTIGKSFQGRDIKAIVISSTGGNDKSKPVIIADAAIHAREWICPSTALYMVNKLVENVTESDLVQNIDWVIVPVLNPDGYEHTHSSTVNRLWRKTRSTQSALCTGVDGNRNFDFKWMVSGSSSNACMDTFAGRESFSESETRALRDVFEEYKGRSAAYIAIHSHGSYFLYPYGYDGSSTPDNAEISSLGVEIGAAIDAASLPESKKYLVGNSGTALYVASGTTCDYAYAVGEAKLAYTLELPSGGLVGFDMPPSRIVQVVSETWEGMIVLGRHVIANARV